ncbi:MAG TPA: WYL domain-containing protein, partial [Acidimicrobiales bacterium]|nr:WYL domain-containing protein [Acidimicrobiales bacterium]
REPAQLTVIKEASEQGRQLELHYYSASSDRESTRTVDPVAVRAIEGRWYLDGYCHNAQGRRRFRIDRVSQAQLTGRPAAAHDDAGPDASSGDAFVPGPEATVAHVAVDDEARWIVEALPTSGVEPTGDGRTRVGIPVVSTVWFGRLMLRLGPHAEVLDPPELADVGRDAARQLLARYQDGAP